MRVEVYWNLHKHCYSVRALEGEDRGRVITHMMRLALSDVTFVVQPAGREKVRRDKRKLVHAFVRGTLDPIHGPAPVDKVTYNPYRDDTFVRLDGERRVPIHSASYVELEHHFVAADGHSTPRAIIFAR